MSDWIVENTETGETWEKESRADAEQALEDFPQMPLEIRNTSTDGGSEVVDKVPTMTETERHTDTANEDRLTGDAYESLPDEKPSVDTDPLTWIPKEFQDEIDGTIAINRKGFEVLAHHYNISCETDMVERTDEIVIHKAEARTENGTVYTAYGEAHSSEDTEHQLVRMSDTRAFKRAVSRATGIGMVAVEELQNSL